MNLRLMVCHVLLASAIAFMGLPLNAESFLGRRLEIVDGRSNKKEDPAPLIVAMHGFLGTARNMQRKSGFDALAARHGFVAAYPNGEMRRWNDGRSPRNSIDDVA